MHDEACPTYEDMINNMMLGHDFILKEFGVKPRIGWQVDPFGHSNANARIFAEMGFDALFFGRLDYQDKEKRLNEKALEWIWTPNSESLGEETNIFTQLMWNSYENPFFDWDVKEDCCEPWINDEGTEVYNAPEWAEKLM